MSKGTQNTIYVAANVMNISATFQLHSPMTSEEEL